MGLDFLAFMVLVLAPAAAAGLGGYFLGARRARARLEPALEELERGLERWAQADLSVGLCAEKLPGRERLAELFDRGQEELLRLLGERKRELARERLKLESLVEHIPDGLVITDLRGEVLYINPPALELLGVKPEAAAGRRIADLVTAPKFRVKIQELLKSHTQADVIELPVSRAGMSATGYFKTTVTLFATPGGEELGMMMILRDVTAERRLDALKEEFFQSVAHDLRAPLFAMQGYLRLLEKSLHLDKHQKGYFDAITQSSEKLTLFIQDTLDSARMETGLLKLAVNPIDPQVLLQRAVTLFRPLAEEKGIHLDLKVPAEFPASVDMDERLMERVFNNLLSNALRVTPRGGAIAVEVAQAGPDHVEFSVVDTGPGVPREMRNQIFEKFHQVEGLGPRAGFGLGLNICQKIVKLHQGMIWVESEPGMGSQFILRIPIRQT